MLNLFSTLFLEDFVEDNIRNRQIEEDFKDAIRTYQEESEDFWSEISDDLGELCRDFHEIQNMVEELGNNVHDTLTNHIDSLDSERYLSFLLSESHPPQVSDHIFAYRIGFTHHGLYAGNNLVIHYENGSVHYDSLDNFRKNMEVYVLPEEESPTRYTSGEILIRAESRLGECDYNLIYNNCEHFVRWCRCGIEP